MININLEYINIFNRGDIIKECGILFPIFSLNNKYGIGTLGRSSYEFIKFLSECKQKYWQILPIGQTGYGDSPYQTFSFYAGNIYLIDLEMLVENNLLSIDDLTRCEGNKIDYSFLYNTKYNILKKAYNNFVIDEEYIKFINNDWLDDYALFMTLKEVFKCNWYELNDCYKYRDIEMLNKFSLDNIEKINFYKFTQYIFFKQYYKMKQYANKHNVKIIGDLPIYASYDSVDVWRNPKQFLLDYNLDMEYVSGGPPDSFSKTGQYWGNPLYDWEYIKITNFKFLDKRFKYNLSLFDKLRIDHFRGYSSYYRIPKNDSAVNGEWIMSYGKELFDCLNLNKERIIIEDLGVITSDVIELVSHTKFTSMKVSVYGLDINSIHYYKNYKYNTVAYSTTHDNIPLMGWYKTLSEKEIEFINNYYGNIIEKLYCSNAKLVIIQLQDVLKLDETSTINIPNTLSNWTFKLNENIFTNEIKNYLIKLVNKYNR